MHEQSLMNDLMRKINSLAKGQGGKKIVRVKLKLGALSHISEEHLKEHFVQAAIGTCAENAHLEVETVKDLNDPQAQEIFLDSIEVED